MAIVPKNGNIDFFPQAQGQYLLEKKVAESIASAAGDSYENLFYRSWKERVKKKRVKRETMAEFELGMEWRKYDY